MTEETRKKKGYCTVEIIQDYKEGKFGGGNFWYKQIIIGKFGVDNNG